MAQPTLREDLSLRSRIGNGDARTLGLLLDLAIAGSDLSGNPTNQDLPRGCALAGVAFGHDARLIAGIQGAAIGGHFPFDLQEIGATV